MSRIYWDTMLFIYLLAWLNSREARAWFNRRANFRAEPAK